jgi:hypothetical protein
MKTFCFGACFVLLAFFAAAETVMVSVGQQGLAVPDAGYRFCLSAVESGLMDVFFDAGHVVFNDEEFRSSEDRFRTVRLARDGGASAVLFVDCVYDSAAARDKKTENGMDVSLPQKIVLSYVRTEDFTVVRESEVRPSARDAEKYPFIENYYALLGRAAAKSIL